MAVTRRRRWDAERRGAFLARLAQGETQTAALQAVGMGRSGLWHAMMADPAFEERRNAALARAIADKAATQSEPGPEDVRAAVVTRRKDGGLKLVAGDERTFTVERQRTFFSVLAETANVSEAARAAEMSLKTVYKWRNRSPAFRMRWIATIDEAMIDLQMEMIEQARAGLAGKPAKMRVGSERLALGLLARHKPGTPAIAAEAAKPSYAERKAAGEKARAKLAEMIEATQARIEGPDAAAATS